MVFQEGGGLEFHIPILKDDFLKTIYNHYQNTKMLRDVWKTTGSERPPHNKDCMRCWDENEDKKWQEELDNLSSSSDNGFVSEKESH